MKKLFIFLFILSVLNVNAQNKNFVVNNYVIQFDTTTKIFEKYQSDNDYYNYSIFTSNYTQRLFNCKEGRMFFFTDTLTTSDVVQIGTTGVYKITIHNALVNTTKRNILIPSANILLSWDSAIQNISFGYDNSGNWPVIIKNTSTSKISVTIFKNGEMFFDVIPTNISIFGVIKKIVIN